MTAYAPEAAMTQARHDVTVLAQHTTAYMMASPEPATAFGTALVELGLEEVAVEELTTELRRQLAWLNLARSINPRFRSPGLLPIVKDVLTKGL